MQTGSTSTARESADRYDVIIVEDEPVSRRALTNLVARNGFHTAAFSTAEAALSAIETSGVPAIVLVDLNLPGMSGIEFVRELDRAGWHPFSVLITAAGLDVVDRLRHSRSMPYFRKPLDFPRLLRMIAEHPLRN